MTSTSIPTTLHSKNFQKLLKSIKAGKSPGNDHNVTAEAHKHGGDQLIEHLWQIFNMVLHSEEATTQWKKTIIIPIAKKLSKSLSNIRGISLMSIAAKTFNRVILHRTYDEISPQLRPFQAGFRRRKSYTSSKAYLNKTIRRAFL